MKYNYEKLIGYSIDTNQIKSSGIITEEDEAKRCVDGIIRIYGEKMFDKMFLITKAFTSYTYNLGTKDKISLTEFLTQKSDLDKFVELYKGFGVDVVINEFEDNYVISLGNGFGKLNPTFHKSFEGYCDFHSTIHFDFAGKYVKQGFWE